MINLPANSAGLNHAVKTRQAQEDGENWQNIQNAQDLPNNHEIYKKRDVEMQRTNRTNKTSATRGVHMRQNALGQNGELDGIYTTPASTQKDAARFDMQADLRDFVRPPAISNKDLEKDALWETSKAVLDVLDQSDASPALKKRAAHLLQEEQNIKSIVSGYQNALIFA